MSNTPEVTQSAQGNVKPQRIDSLIGSARVHFPQMKGAIGHFIAISYCCFKSKVDDNLAKCFLYRDSPWLYCWPLASSPLSSPANANQLVCILNTLHDENASIYPFRPRDGRCRHARFCTGITKEKQKKKNSMAPSSSINTTFKGNMTFISSYCKLERCNLTAL